MVCSWAVSQKSETNSSFTCCNLRWSSDGPMRLEYVEERAHHDASRVQCVLGYQLTWKAAAEGSRVERWSLHQLQTCEMQQDWQSSACCPLVVQRQYISHRLRKQVPFFLFPFLFYKMTSDVAVFWSLMPSKVASLPAGPVRCVLFGHLDTASAPIIQPGQLKVSAGSETHFSIFFPSFKYIKYNYSVKMTYIKLMQKEKTPKRSVCKIWLDLKVVFFHKSFLLPINSWIKCILAVQEKQFGFILFKRFSCASKSSTHWTVKQCEPK